MTVLAVVQSMVSLLVVLISLIGSEPPAIQQTAERPGPAYPLVLGIVVNTCR
jgi:hypothetical protein